MYRPLIVLLDFSHNMLLEAATAVCGHDGPVAQLFHFYKIKGWYRPSDRSSVLHRLLQEASGSVTHSIPRYVLSTLDAVNRRHDLHQTSCGNRNCRHTRVGLRWHFALLTIYTVRKRKQTANVTIGYDGR